MGAHVDPAEDDPEEDLGPLFGQIPEAILYLTAILAIVVGLAVLALGVIPT